MKKLNLNKQTIVKLSPAEQSEINGGGIKRSRRLNGDCRYSRKHPDVAISDTTNGQASFIGYCAD